MPQNLKKMARKAGMPPGSLVDHREKTEAPACITIIHYSETEFTQNEYNSFAQCLLVNQESGVTWINVNGTSQTQDLEKLGECFNIHSLVLEDILDTGQRPKVEDYETYLYIVLKTMQRVPEEEDDDNYGGDIQSNQVSLILGPHYVISFHEGDGDLFAPVRERVQSGRGRIRKLGADYLAYTLMDAIVDNYFVQLEKFADVVETLEDEVVLQPTSQTLREIHRIKNAMIMLRKSLWPLREVIARLERRESPLIKQNLVIYFKDIYDHTIIAIETVESYRDILSDTLDVYLSSVNNRLADIMRVLTIIATIFMPLNFITSFYGMNFKNMPELGWHYGYFGAIGLILVVACSMILYFKKKDWI